MSTVKGPLSSRHPRETESVRRKWSLSGLEMVCVCTESLNRVWSSRPSVELYGWESERSKRPLLTSVLRDSFCITMYLALLPDIDMFSS